MSIKDMPDPLAVECWEAVADSISWDEYIRDGKRHPKSIIADAIDKAFYDGYACGICDSTKNTESTKDVRKRLGFPTITEEAQTANLQMNLDDFIK